MISEGWPNFLWLLFFLQIRCSASLVKDSPSVLISLFANSRNGKEWWLSENITWSLYMWQNAITYSICKNIFVEQLCMIPLSSLIQATTVYSRFGWEILIAWRKPTKHVPWQWLFQIQHYDTCSMLTFSNQCSMWPLLRTKYVVIHLAQVLHS